MSSETPSDYELFKPKIKTIDRSWLDNIFNHTQEEKDILTENGDYLLVPDYKWFDQDSPMNMHYLIFFKCPELLSIRDIDDSNVDCIADAIKNCKKVISEKFNIEFNGTNYFKCEFHYHPSVWQLHVHIYYFHDSSHINKSYKFVEQRHRNVVLYDAFEVIENVYRDKHFYKNATLKIA